MKLSIIIPAHNEEKRIGKTLNEYLPFFSDLYKEDVEFIVVINGTTDNTEGVVGEIAKDYPILSCIVEKGNIGKGGAVVKGFLAAKGDLIGFTDADCATPPRAFKDLVDNIGDAHAIIASRWHKGSDVSPRQTLGRRMASRTFNFFTRAMFGLKLSDTQCGAKLMRRDAILDVIPLLGVTRWAFDVDMLYQLKHAGHNIKESATIWHDVEGSKVRVFRTSIEMFMALVRLRLIHSPFRWIIRLYRPQLFPFIRKSSDMNQNL